jgi:hypothetical protein
LKSIEKKGTQLGYIRSGFDTTDKDYEENHEPGLGEMEEELIKNLNILGSYRFYLRGKINPAKILVLKNLKKKD